MAYDLIISERANELIDRLAAYLLNNLKNPGAAAHFLDELDAVYDRLIDNPFQFLQAGQAGTVAAGIEKGRPCVPDRLTRPMRVSLTSSLSSDMMSARQQTII